MRLGSAQQRLGVLEPVLQLRVPLPRVLKIHRQLRDLGLFVLQLVATLPLLRQRQLGVLHRRRARLFQNVQLVRLLLCVAQLLLERAGCLLELLLELARTFQLLCDPLLQVPGQPRVVRQLRAALRRPGLLGAQPLGRLLQLGFQRGCLHPQRVVGRLLGLQLVLEGGHGSLQLGQGGRLLLVGFHRLGKLLLQLVHRLMMCDVVTRVSQQTHLLSGLQLLGDLRKLVGDLVAADEGGVPLCSDILKHLADLHAPLRQLLHVGLQGGLGSGGVGGGVCCVGGRLGCGLLPLLQGAPQLRDALLFVCQCGAELLLRG